MIRSAPCSRQPATAPRPTMPGAEHDAGRALLHLGRLDRGAEPGREAAGEQRRALERRLGVDLRERDLRHHRVLGERRGAHEVPDPLAVAAQPRRAVGEVAVVLLLADREAEIGLRRAAVDALAALRREERDDVVAGRDERHVGARPSRPRRRPRARAPSARSRTGRRRTPCRGRCGRRRRPRAAPAPRRPSGSSSSTSWTTSGSPNASRTAARIFMRRVTSRAAGSRPPARVPVP